MTKEEQHSVRNGNKGNGDAIRRNSSVHQRSVIFSFKKIGPVKKAELELGDLTIIAGRNNTGKSYLVYTLYGFLKMWDSWPGIQQFLTRNGQSRVGIPDMSKIARRLISDGTFVLDAHPVSLANQRKEVLRQLCLDFSEDAISQVFSSQSGNFDDASINIEVQDEEGFNVGSPVVTYQISGANSLKFEIKENQLVLVLDVSNRRKPPPDLEYIVAAGYLELLLAPLFPEPFILSAERFGISLFYRELDFTKNQLVDLLQKMGSDKDRDKYSPFFFIDRATSRYALPIKDNIDYTRSLPERRKDKSEFFSAKPFNHIKNMMDGYFSATGDELRFISKARGPDRSFNVPLHLASSSARGLSDLYFFLRHVAKRNHLLIIDEPESHLDTANQIRLARLLARLVRMGLKVLITTHSDYLIKEINNLIMLESDFEGRDAVLRSLKYTDDDVLQRTSIRGYVAKDSGLVPCEVDRFGINMPLFDDTIDDINRVANELSSRLEAERD